MTRIFCLKNIRVDNQKYIRLHLITNHSYSMHQVRQQQSFGLFKRIIIKGLQVCKLPHDSCLIQDALVMALQSLDTLQEALALVKFCTKLENLQIDQPISLQILDALANIKTLKSLIVLLDRMPTKQIYKNMSNIQSLQIYKDTFGSRQLSSACQNMPQLKYIGLIKQFKEKDIQTLLKMKNIEEICIEDSNLTIQIIQKLTKTFSFLKYLDLNNCNLFDSSIKVIANNMKQLETLHLYNNNITKRGVEMFGVWKNTLKRLMIGRNDIGFQGVQFISFNMVSLLELGLERCRLQDDWMLAISKGLLKLQMINLSFNELITMDGFEMLLQRKSKLKQLLIKTSTNLNGKIVKMISQNINGLINLNLGICENISNSSCFYLSLTKLKYIYLHQCNIGDIGAIKLVRNKRNSLLRLSGNLQISRRAQRNMSIIKWESLMSFEQ